MAEREIVLLSGMHRSGTSALARVFNLLGAVLPEPLVPPSLGNELGHWEPAEAVAMNDAALAAAGADVNGLHPFSSEWVGAGGGEAFTEEVRAWLERVAQPGALTVVKDPRIALLAPFWRTAVERLGARPRFVVSWRDPWEVARSLASRQLEHFPDEVWPHARVELLWLKHQLELERASRSASRSFVAYASLLDDWRPLMARIRGELDLSAAPITPEQAAAVEDFLRPEARRQRRPEEAEAPSPAAAEVLRLLEARVGRPEGGAQAFDRAAARFDDALRLLGGYLAALEIRVAADADAAGEAGDVRTLISALRDAAQAAELRAAETVLRRDASPASADDDASAALEELQVRHDGLRAEHAQLSERMRASEATAAARLGRLVRDHARDVAQMRSEAERADHAGEARRTALEEHATEVERSHQARLAELKENAADVERSHQARLAALEAEARELAREGDARLDALVRRQGEAADRAAGAEARAQNAEAEASRLLADATRLGAEVDGYRSAYENLRLEAAAASTEATSLRRELGDARARLQAMLAERDRAQDAADALRASTSWRLTRPVRSAAFRVRRLVRG